MNDNPQVGAESKRDKIRRKYGGAQRDGTEVRRARKESSIFDENKVMRVGVYCRVSTGNTEQLSSYIMQQKYYSQYVERHPGWVLVEIYADEGISGTSLKHRDNFLRMLRDCEEDKLDLIVVKSVSRFARCTEDFLVCINNLKSHRPPIGVFFENDGMYSLDNSRQLPLTLLAGFAQEESHAKSAGMNSSIEQRFSYNIFLTPPLLGYDHDEDGNLVVNEDEAETVRLIFSMYQYGYSCTAIAETLVKLGRQTKTGSRKWSASAIHGVLRNERHCGDVLARKTWTPNYLDHKSVKNRVDANGEYDRNQYYKRDHHTGIIPRNDYIAVQKMIANAKYGGRSFMPILRVNKGGAFHGFVSVNPRWGSFHVEDYICASNSIGEDIPSRPLWCARRGEVDLRGYEVVREQFFSAAEITCGSFYHHNARFSGACIRQLDSAEYIELLVHPTEKLLAVRECDVNDRHAIRWAKLIGEKAYTRQFGGMAYLGTLFELFSWNPAWGYRLRGTVRCVEGMPVAFFDAREAEVLIPQKSPWTNPMESRCSAAIIDELYIAAHSKYRITALPSAWRHNFGNSYYGQAAYGAHLSQAGAGIGTEHNTEPNLHPTARDVLAHTIRRILTKFQNKEEPNGLSHHSAFP